MGENSSGGSSCIVEIIVAIIILAIFALICRYIWLGTVWAFGQYVDLLRVN